MSRLPANKPGDAARLELLERRLVDLERRTRSTVARGGGPPAEQTAQVVQQTAHGLTVGQAVRHNGSAWVAAKADTAANAVVGGIVVAVLSPDVWVLATSGYVTGLSGLTAGSVHYLSAATAGALTTTAPSIAVSIIQADSTTSGVLAALGGASGPGDGTACTVLGRSANSTGVRADISAGTDGTWLGRLSGALAFVRDVILGTTSNAGSLTIANATSATAIVISPTLVSAAGKVMSVREIDVCDAGVAKKMLVLASAPYSI